MSPIREGVVALVFSGEWDDAAEDAHGIMEIRENGCSEPTIGTNLVDCWTQLRWKPWIV